jgi:hypothetical protein
MEIIEFPYRGRVVRVTPESTGWRSHLKFSEEKLDPLNPRNQDYSTDGFYKLPVGLLNSACDAVVAAMQWVDAKAVLFSMHYALDELVVEGCIERDDLSRLTASIRDEWVKTSPQGEPHV